MEPCYHQRLVGVWQPGSGKLLHNVKCGLFQLFVCLFHNPTLVSIVAPFELGLGIRNARFFASPFALRLGIHNPRFVAGPFELGLGICSPCFVAWPVELRLGTRNARGIVITLRTVFAVHGFVSPCVPIKMQGVGLLEFMLGYSTIPVCCCTSLGEPRIGVHVSPSWMPSPADQGAGPGSCRIVWVHAHHDRGDACGGGIRKLADVQGHAHVRQELSDHCCILLELQQGVCYQQEVIAIRLHPRYAFEPQGCSRLECSQWERFPPEQFLWEHHWNKCRRLDSKIHHHEFQSS